MKVEGFRKGKLTICTLLNVHNSVDLKNFLGVILQTCTLFFDKTLIRCVLLSIKPNELYILG